jgi:polyhydroxybutyrate depolymerase
MNHKHVVKATCRKRPFGRQNSQRTQILLYSRFKHLVREAFCGIDTRMAGTAPIESVELLRPEGTRHYLKAVPSQISSGKRPLVIVLHGSGASAAQVLGMAFPPSPLSMWLEIAEREQLVIVAPDGSKRRGERCWNDSFAEIASNPRTDDTGFISAIIDQAIADDDVDPARVYVMGVSKGGMMAYRLATEIAPKLAAFAVVLASMPVNSNCGLPKVPLSALIVAGTSDPFIPYVGGKFPYTLWFLAPMMSVEASVAVWRTLAALPLEPAIDNITHRNASDATRATRFMWGSDPKELQVGLLRIEHGGHAEPSKVKRYPSLFNWFPGAQNADVEVAEEAWEFFRDKRSGLLAHGGHCAAGDVELGQCVAGAKVRC